MLPVYLLEDDVEQQIEYSKVIQQSIENNRWSMKLACQTMSPLELLSVAQVQDGEYGLFFLDMEISSNSKAGLQVAKEIRRLLPKAHIVFLSVHDELAFLTIERRISPLDFIDKDHGFDVIQTKMLEDMNYSLSAYREVKEPNKTMFSYRIGSRYFAVPLSQVLYLTTSQVASGHILLHTKNHETEFLGSLNDLEHRYSSFFRTDKSYLVNLEQSCNYDNKEKVLRFEDGSFAYVSVRRAHDLMKYFR
ncbi:DNA-binding response regulator [Bombilactobacillus folatiphilus]|uniref:DNA-binding response regulator n=1 Tax=Bombilactobacillus folatiphilus TaxID=2923362 RepID=A0ABY4P7P1_9LACO|nr:LytTR family transcriptional regulator DNA-binding domain-containing protein [Bombilactobacillus folatiphilus]UQS81672.1 DNA-binding response regulator [Bombilactobacillus folatiphilus]